jgi:hypothetical protein
MAATDDALKLQRQPFEVGDLCLYGREVSGGKLIHLG